MVRLQTVSTNLGMPTNNYSMKKTLSAWIVGSLTMFLVGCDQDEIKVYRVGKEPASSISTKENTIPLPTATEQLEWTIPSGWEQKASSSMRYGSFAISGKNGQQADLSVVTLAGEAGGALANINRWRDQLALPPISAEQLPNNSSQLEVSDAKIVLVHFASSKPLQNKKNKTGVLAAILPRTTSTWFFKMTGDEALVEAQKARFTQFLKSLRFTASSEISKIGLH